MNGPNLLSRLWSWILLVVAGAIALSYAWSLVRPLVVPVSVSVVVVAIALIAFRYWRSRHFW